MKLQFRPPGLLAKGFCKRHIVPRVRPVKELLCT